MHTPNDKAGATITKSTALAGTTTSANVGHAGDIDWYEFNCDPGTYRLTTTAGNGLDIDLDFCNSSGTVLTEEHNTGNVNKIVQLVGTKYYIKVFVKSSSARGGYTLTYQAQ